MDIELHTSKLYDVFILKGEIRIATLVTVSATLARHIDKNPHKDLVLDLSQVEYIDSSGLRMLINLQRKLETLKKRVMLLSPSAQTNKLLDETRTVEVFTIIQSLESLDQQAQAELCSRLRSFSRTDNGQDLLHLSCGVCGSDNTIGYVFDPTRYDWSWTHNAPFPVSRTTGSDDTIDILGNLPCICMECFYASINPTDFNVLDNSEVIIRSDLSDSMKNLLSKSIKKRKKMLQGTPLAAESFFAFPRNKNAAYMGYLLSEFCLRTISVTKEASNPFAIGYLNYCSLMYAPMEDKDDLINNCRTWFTQALNQIDTLTELEIAISYFAVMVADINLRKFEEGVKAFNSIKERYEKIPPPQAPLSFNSPAFWYGQAISIWQNELESKSQVFKG